MKLDQISEAYINMLQLKNEERLDELSKDTLKSYVEKSVETLAKRVDNVTNPNSEKGQRKINKVPSVGLFGFKNKNAKSLAKDSERERIAASIKSASTKLTKEDFDEMTQEEFELVIENYDQLDEASKDALKSYLKKLQIK